MGKINWGRVILGGIVAGVVVNVFEGVAGMLWQQEYQAAMAALGKTMEMTTSLMVFYLAYGFVYGVFAIWFYAAIRPRFGAGPKTAACAALAVWFIGYLFPLLGYYMGDLWPGPLVLKGSVLGFVETMIGTLLGAWLYKEA